MTSLFYSICTLHACFLFFFFGGGLLSFTTSASDMTGKTHLQCCQWVMLEMGLSSLYIIMLQRKAYAQRQIRQLSKLCNGVRIFCSYVSELFV